MPEGMKLPPGATLVSDGGGMALPPGATLVSSGSVTTSAPASRSFMDRLLHPEMSGFASVNRGGDLTSSPDQASSMVRGTEKGLTSTMGGLSGLAGGPKATAVETRPQGAGEHVGNAIENIMEFVGGDEALKGLSEAAKLKELAPVAAMLQKFPRLTNILTVGLRQGIVGGGQTLAKGGTPSEAATSGAVSGAIAGGGEVVADLLPKAASTLKQAAQKQYGQFLNPTKEATKYQAEQIIPRLLEDRQIITSGKALEQTAAAKTAEIGQQIGEAVKNVPPTVKPLTRFVTKSLDDYKQQFIVNGVPINQAAVNGADALKDTINALGDDVSFQSLNRVRQILDQSVAQAKGFVGKTLAEGSTVDVQKEASNAIRRELARQSPDIAKLNGEYHFWSQVGDVIEATNARRVGQQGGMTRIVAPIVGAGTGLHLGGFTPAGGLEAVGGAAALTAAAELVRSPLWRTTSAVLKNEVANAIVRGDIATITRIAARIAAASGASASRSDQAQAQQ